MFPIIGGEGSVPWSLVERWRKQIERNHSQTLERLAERGGLSPLEFWFAAHGRRLSLDGWPPDHKTYCAGWLDAEIEQYVATEHWPHLLARVLVTACEMAVKERDGWRRGNAVGYDTGRADARAQAEGRAYLLLRPEPTSWGGWAL